MQTKTGLSSYTELKEKIIGQQNPIAQHLSAFIYAGCARKGEISRPDYFHAPKRLGEMSIQAQDLYFEPNSTGQNLLRLKIKTTKTKSDITQRIVPLNSDKEKWLCDILLNWKENYSGYLAAMNLKNKTPTELFPFSSAYTYYLIKKNFGFKPHRFRAMRATHYLVGSVTGKPMSPDHVARIGGWNNLQTLFKYYAGVMMDDISKGI